MRIRKVLKANAWLDSSGSLGGSSVDRAQQPSRKLSADTNTVEVIFRTRAPNKVVVVRLDVHTGKVQSSGQIIGDTFR